MIDLFLCDPDAVHARPGTELGTDSIACLRKVPVLGREDEGRGEILLCYYVSDAIPADTESLLGNESGSP